MDMDIHTSSADYDALKQDFNHHPLTSRASLRRLARLGRATPVDKKKRQRLQAQVGKPQYPDAEKRQYWPQPSTHVADHLAEAEAWLDIHADQLPPELNTEGGRSNGVVEKATGDHYELALASLVSAEDYEGLRHELANDDCYATSVHDYEQAIYDIGEPECMKDLHHWGQKYDEAHCGAHDRLYAWLGIHPLTYAPIMNYRGQAYAHYRKCQENRVRRHELGEYEGVYQARKLFDEGVRLETAQLPPLTTLLEWFDYDGVDLTWRKTKGPRAQEGSQAYTSSNGRMQTKLDGVAYSTARIAYYMYHGIDPIGRSLSFANGDPSDLSISNLSLNPVGEVIERVRKTCPNVWNARLKVNGTFYFLGDFASPELAQAACDLCHTTLAQLTIGDWQ